MLQLRYVGLSCQVYWLYAFLHPCSFKERTKSARLLEAFVDGSYTKRLISPKMRKILLILLTIFVSKNHVFIDITLVLSGKRSDKKLHFLYFKLNYVYISLLYYL